MNCGHMTAPCGLDCYNCFFYWIDDKEIRDAVYESMMENAEVKDGLKHLEPLAAYACQGCRNENGFAPPFEINDKQEQCKTFKCCSDKGIEFCADCPEFPCDRLIQHADRAAEVPHDTKKFNMCLIKKMGLESRAMERVKRVHQTYFKGERTS